MKPSIPRTRFDAFSDAVFAIAITIMVLELKVPSFHGDVTNDDVVMALSSQIPVFIAYLASFSILTQLWISHSTLTKETEEITVRSAQLNLLLLFFVCLIPFPMALLGEFGFKPAVIVPYVIVLAAASTSLGVLRASFLSQERASEQRKRVQRNRIYACLLISLCGVVLAFLGQISQWISVAALIIVGLASLSYRVIR